MAMSKLRSRVRERYTDRRLQAKESTPMNTNMEAVRIMFRRYRESVNAELKGGDFRCVGARYIPQDRINGGDHCV